MMMTKPKKAMVIMSGKECHKLYLQLKIAAPFATPVTSRMQP